jgi:hypothetical protein
MSPAALRRGASSHATSGLPQFSTSSSKRSARTMVAQPIGALFFSAKRTADCLKKKNAAGSPFGLACDPQSATVASDEEERNRLAENSGIWPAREFGDRASRRERLASSDTRIAIETQIATSIATWPIAFYDEAYAAQKRVRGLPGHDLGYVWATRLLPRLVLVGTATRLCISRRHRAISCLERRNVISGIARFVRSAK